VGLIILGVTLLPLESFIAPVEGSDDLVRFRYDFTLAGKALEDGGTEAVVIEADNGDLIIEGYAAVFEGVDRQGENFVDGAFQRGIKAFLDSTAALCFHHKHDQVLGKVLDLHEEEGKGLKMRARVDGAIKSHPVLGTYYQQIKNGTLNGLSVGGFFKRAMTDAGQRIADMDFTEISVTGVPVHTGPRFDVIAGKALASDLTAEHVKLDQVPEEEIREEDFAAIQWALEMLDQTFRNLKKRGSTQTDDRTPAVL
jgi:HK97 family phage prohead protease